MENVLTDEKFDSIIRNTIIDTNNVLIIWEANKKVNTFEDKKSLVRGNLAKYFKHYFGWQVYKRNIQKYEILPTIIDYKLLKINIVLGLYDSKDIYIQKLREAIDRSNVIEISEKFNQPSLIEDKNNTLDVKSLVNYESITNIKFN